MPINYGQLQTNASLKDVQRKNNFSIVFPSFLTIDLQLYLDSFPFPKQGNVVKDVRTGNMVSKYAGAFEATENVSVKFREYLDRKTSDALQGWRAQVANQETGAVFLSKTYKQNGTLMKLAPDGTEGQAQFWTLERCWLADYKEDDYDQGNDGDLVLVTFTLVVENIYKSTSKKPLVEGEGVGAS
jgi:phage-related protein